MPLKNQSYIDSKFVADYEKGQTIHEQIGNLSKRVDYICAEEFPIIVPEVDDASRLQRAIDYARDNDLALYLLKPLYEVGKTLTFYDNSHLISINGSIIKAKTAFTQTGFTFTFQGSNYTNYPVFFADGKTNIRIENIEVDANRTVQTVNNVSGILFNNCTKLSFLNVKSKSNKATDGASFAGGAFSLLSCSDVDIDKCGVDDVDVEGLFLRECTSVRVKGGEYKNSTSSCIGTQNGSDITIDGVKAHDATNAVVSLNSINSKITGSTVYNSTAFVCINLGHRTDYATRKPASGSIASDNHVYGGYKAGIYIGYGFDIDIHDNHVWDCRGAYDATDLTNAYGGISASYWNDRIKIHDNKVWNCNRGIYCVFGKKDATNGEYTYGRVNIHDNEVFNNILYGIDVRDVVFGARIKDNTVYGNNTEQTSTRAEIALWFTGANPDNEIGDVVVRGNKIGRRTAESVSVNGIYISNTVEVDPFILPVIVELNEFNNITNPIKLSGYTDKDIINRNNYINGKMQQAPRITFSDTTSTIDIGYCTYIRLSPASAVSIDTINHKHDVGTEIVVQFANTNATLTRISGSGNLFLSSSSFAGRTDNTITLKWSGGGWYEKGRNTYGHGLWTNPMQWGSNYLWFDSTGKLRTKAGSPTSETDGTIVGTQA